MPCEIHQNHYHVAETKKPQLEAEVCSKEYVGIRVSLTDEQRNS